MIRDAEPRDYRAVAELMRDFLRWHRRRHATDQAMLDNYFDPEGYEAELRALPGEYGPPPGALLVAEDGGDIVGCVCLKQIGEGICEMKRLFVDPNCHGKGVGQALARAIIERGKALGYAKMMLDTGPKQVEAQTLYRKLGFRPVEPYYEMSPEVRDWLVFMERDLDD